MNMKAMRNIPQTAGYKKGDVLVIFGELFSKGYVNGIVDEAKKAGMTIIHSTVGRRDSNGELRALNDEESSLIPKPFINIPLEAGFDMEKDATGISPCDQLQGVKMKEWNKDLLDWSKIEDSQNRATERFRSQVSKYMAELNKHIPEGANVLFVHTMAGGMIRAKVLMPTLNKVFKGRDDRYISSNELWSSDLGKLCEKNFVEVTANTFKHLVDLSEPIRKKTSGKVSYIAYGYHGTEVLIDGEYQWQTYTPYVQGWAKMVLEQQCTDFTSKGIPCCVFNCPEILTNSSSIFQGVEVSLYPLMGAIRKEGASSKYCSEVLEKCQSKLTEETSIDAIMDFTSQYVKNPLIQEKSDLNNWPQHNSKEQMAFMLDSSNTLIDMHKDKKDMITFLLSEEVFKATGPLMLNESWNITEPVLWLNHDILSKQMASQG